MGQGEEDLFEKKMTKEERKAAKAAVKAAKSKEKKVKKEKAEPVKELTEEERAMASLKLADQRANANSEESKRAAALDKLSEDNIICTYAQEKKAPAATDKDINVSEVTVTFHGKPLIEDSDITINYGNR